jgi:hypothetical protein
MMRDQLDDISQQTTLVARWQMVDGELQFVGLVPRPRDTAIEAEMEQDELDPDDDQPSWRA